MHIYIYMYIGIYHEVLKLVCLCAKQGASKIKVGEVCKGFYVFCLRYSFNHGRCWVGFDFCRVLVHVLVSLVPAFRVAWHSENELCWGFVEGFARGACGCH